MSEKYNKFKINCRYRTQEKIEEIMRENPELVKLCPIPYLGYKEDGRNADKIALSADLISEDHCISVSFGHIPFTTNLPQTNILIAKRFLINALEAMDSEVVEISVVEDGLLVITEENNKYSIAIAGREHEEGLFDE